jgi:hypothetical protein
MRFFGTIQNSKDNEPVVYAKIKISIQDKEIATIFSDENGEYEYKTDEDYVGQNLTYSIEKDGFETKTFSSVIDDAEMQKKFLLREHEIVERGRTGYFIAGLLIAAAIILIIYFIQPTFSIDQESLDFNDMALNNKSTKDFTISKKGLGDMKWEVWTNKSWVEVDPTNGSNNGSINVTIYTPDNEFSPVSPGVKFNATIYVDSRGWFGREEESIDLSFYISEKRYEPILSVEPMLSVEPPFTKVTVSERALPKDKLSSHEITIKNEGNGTLYWSVRDNSAWIRLIGTDGQEKAKITGTDNDTVKFAIDFSGLKLEQNKTKEGIITVESNNDGKVKIHISLTRIDSTRIEINARKEEWFLPRLFFNLGQEAAGGTSASTPASPVR